jgi:hypothetical protein
LVPSVAGSPQVLHAPLEQVCVAPGQSEAPPSPAHEQCVYPAPKQYALAVGSHDPFGVAVAHDQHSVAAAWHAVHALTQAWVAEQNREPSAQPAHEVPARHTPWQT